MTHSVKTTIGSEHDRRIRPRAGSQWKRWRAVADLYHAYFTGLILTVVTRRGTADAAEFVFRVFRRQQQERFLPGLRKARARAICRRRSPLRNIIISRTGSAACTSNTCMRATPRPGSAIRRRAGSGRAPRSAACRARSRARCCAAGTPITAWRSAISDSASSAPSRASTARTGSKAITIEYDHPLELDQRLVFARHLEAPLFDADDRAGVCRSRAGQSRGWKKPIATMRWNMCAPPRP